MIDNSSFAFGFLGLHAFFGFGGVIFGFLGDGDEILGGSVFLSLHWINLVNAFAKIEERVILGFDGCVECFYIAYFLFDIGFTDV